LSGRENTQKRKEKEKDTQMILTKERATKWKNDKLKSTGEKK